MRGLIGFIFRVTMISLVMFAGAVLAAGTLFLQDRPMLKASAPPDAADVATTRSFMQNIRAAADGTGATGNLLLTDVDQLNSAMRLGSRFITGFRGRVTIEGNEVRGDISLPVPWWTGQKWLNVTGRAPEFTGTLSPSHISVGGRELPPGLMLKILRIGANLGAGNRLGDTILNAASAMTVTGKTLAFRLTLDEMGKNGVMRGAFGALKGGALPTPDEIEAYHLLIRQAMEEGRLPRTGSFLPYLRFTLEAALNGDAAKALPERYSAAILGLAKACGAQDFALIVGRLVFQKNTQPRAWRTSCTEVTLNGRIDSRRHFLTSAALQALSNTGFAVSAGEFKELYDTISGAGGFDFTDMTANLSGIRLSNMLMSRSAQDWPKLLAQLDSEAAVVPTFQGIPTLMSDAEFKERFGDIDSPNYREMLARIETRIDALKLHNIN